MRCDSVNGDAVCHTVVSQNGAKMNRYAQKRILLCVCFASLASFGLLVMSAKYRYTNLHR